MSTNFPSGFVLSTNGITTKNALLLDINAYVVGTKISRNVLSCRNVARSATNTLKQENFFLEKRTSTSVQPVEFVFTSTQENTMTLMSSNFPVTLEVVTATSNTVFENVSIFVLSSQIQQLKFKNFSIEDDVTLSVIQS